MNIVRLLIIGAAIWLAIMLLRRLISPRPRPMESRTNATSTMVKCAHCGLHIPESEAILHHGHYYCCQEHRRQHTTK